MGDGLVPSKSPSGVQTVVPPLLRMVPKSRGGMSGALPAKAPWASPAGKHTAGIALGSYAEGIGEDEEYGPFSSTVEGHGTVQGAAPQMQHDTMENMVEIDLLLLG